MEFVLASGNSHKAAEFNTLFDAKVINIVAAPRAIEIVEDGHNYYENALKKAEGYYQKFNCPVMSDDSGLNVDALPTELGIQSARFGGEGLSFNQRIDLLLDKLKAIPKEERTASFSCVLCFYLNSEEIYYFEGKVDGIICDTPQGEQGFGYDPVFIPNELIKENKTFAMVPDWKEQNSHRARASQKAMKFFIQTNCQS